MEESLTIRLKIAGRNYPLKVKKSKEAIFREAAGLINNQIEKYAQTFRKSDDKQDYLAMVAIQFTVNKLDCENNTVTLDEEMTSRLEYIDSLLSDNTIR